MSYPFDVKELEALAMCDPQGELDFWETYIVTQDMMEMQCDSEKIMGMLHLLAGEVSSEFQDAVYMMLKDHYYAKF